MKLINNYLFIIISILSIGCGKDKSSNVDKIGFMENRNVFEAFQMKKDYDERIKSDLKELTMVLDDLRTKASEESKSDSLAIFRLQKQYYEAEQNYNTRLKELSERYTLEVNNRLNEYLKKYSIENGYSLILGSEGQGNVMYIADEKNITKELIKYINQQYEN